MFIPSRSSSTLRNEPSEHKAGTAPKLSTEKNNMGWQPFPPTKGRAQSNLIVVSCACGCLGAT